MNTLLLFSGDPVVAGTSIDKVISVQTAPDFWQGRSDFHCEPQDLFIAFENRDALLNAKHLTGWLEVPGCRDTLLMPYVIGGFTVSLRNSAIVLYPSWKLTTQVVQ